MERAVLEKVFAAEKRLAGLRLLVIASGTLTFPLLTDVPGTVRPLAWTLLGLAWLYGLYVYAREPYRRYPLLLSSYFTSTLDALFTMIWLHATGGYHSPYYVVLYPAVVSVAFRYAPRHTLVASLVYGGGYLVLLAGLGQLDDHPVEVAIRVTYVFLSALLGAAIAREVLAQTATAVRLEEGGRLAREQAAREAAEEAVRARDEFLSLASHELKTPLTAAVLLADTMVRDGGEVGPEQRRTRLQRLIEQMLRLDALVDRLLDVSRITSGRLVLEPRQLHLSELLARIADRWRVPLAAAHSSLETRIAPGVTGQWDPLRVEQVIANLMSNAAKYGGEKPVVLALDAAAETVRISVRDQGIGIAPEDQKRVFERFERAATQEQYSGMGLGLWISRRVVEAMGGTLSLVSTPGEGSTFTVELPFAAKP